MKLIDLAIIIPTLNEENFIGKLLDSIASQTVYPCELVVVDAYSKDRTIQEIKKRQSKLSQLKYFQIKRSTVSRQRNLGVKNTKAPHLLFLDADMELRGKDNLEKYFDEVLKKHADIACASSLPGSNYWKDAIYFKFEDRSIKLMNLFWPGFTGRNMYIKRSIFERVGGFDEEIAVGEDYEIVKRIIKLGSKLVFLKSVSLFTSTRRVELEGRRNYILKILLFGIKILFFGYKKARVEYEFGKFKKIKS